MKRVFYFGFYTETDHIPERNPVFSPATTSKMKFIAEVLSPYFDTTIVSPGFSVKRGVSLQKTVTNKEKQNCIPRLFGDGRRNLTFPKVLFARKQLKKFIREYLTQDDAVIIYSQPWSLGILCHELTKKGLQPILELEELHYTNKLIPLWKRMIFKNVEKKAIDAASNLIVVNDILNKEINKNSLVCHGMYRFPKDTALKRLNHKKIRLLYSGAIDPERGVFLFLESLKTLPRNFKNEMQVDITGYFHGPEFISLQEQMNRAVKALFADGFNIDFKGLLPEEELEDLVSMADICISPQLIENNFSSFSFPSKILYYLSFGKLVVSSSLPCINESPFKNFLVTYDKDDPNLLREAIIKAIHFKEVFYEQEQEKLISLMRNLFEAFSKGLISMIQKDN